MCAGLGIIIYTMWNGWSWVHFANEEYLQLADHVMSATLFFYAFLVVVVESFAICTVFAKKRAKEGAQFDKADFVCLSLIMPVVCFGTLATVGWVRAAAGGGDTVLHCTAEVAGPAALLYAMWLVMALRHLSEVNSIATAAAGSAEAKAARKRPKRVGHLRLL
jgi:hypothetical protein